MADLLIRDVPDNIVAALDSKARREGISRSEYLRRLLVRERAIDQPEMTVEDLTRFSRTFRDLDDPDVMRAAWE
jgi:hypothetical protein